MLMLDVKSELTYAVVDSLVFTRPYHMEEEDSIRNT